VLPAVRAKLSMMCILLGNSIENTSFCLLLGFSPFSHVFLSFYVLSVFPRIVLFMDII